MKEEKERLDFKIYTVICEADRVEKDFSDGVIVINLQKEERKGNGEKKYKQN